MARDDQAGPMRVLVAERPRAAARAGDSGRLAAPPDDPDALHRIARAIVAQIRSRQAYLPEVRCEDPEWLMLLELFIASGSGRQVTVSNLCAASGVPSTTALRHIGLLERNGLLIRTPAAKDRRISHVRLHERAQRRLQSYLSSIAPRWPAGNDEPLPA